MTLANCKTCVFRHFCAYTFAIVVLGFAVFYSIWYNVAQPGHVTGISVASRAIPSDSDDNVLVFMQVSDIHISTALPERAEQFNTFLSRFVKTINPAFVVATGDIADSYSHPQTLSFYKKLKEQEYIPYKELLTAHGYYRPDFWIDVRGNHDSYGLVNNDDETNYFAKYGVYGQNGRIYSHTVSQSFGSYRVLAVDGALVPGVQPLNLFGYLDNESMRKLHTELTHSGSVYNATIVISHFCLYAYSHHDFLVSNHRSMPDLRAWLCGHNHLPRMQQRIPFASTDVFDLELEDMRKHQAFRVLTFDHDLLSFRDYHMHEGWPLIVITNPKEARYLSEKEPVGLIVLSSHIRALVYSESNILSVSYSITGDHVYTGDMSPAAHISNNHTALYVASWDPSLLSNGLHLLTVIASDETQTRSVTITFSVDGTIEGIGFGLPKFAQTLHFYTVAQAVFYLCYSIFFIVYLVLPTFLDRLHWLSPQFSYTPLQAGFETKNITLSTIKKDQTNSELTDPTTQTRDSCMQCQGEDKIDTTPLRLREIILDNLYRSSLISPLHRIILASLTLNLGIGPIIVGPLLQPSKFGAIFAYGTVISGRFVVDAFTYVQAIFFLFLLYLPFTLIIRYFDVARQCPLYYGNTRVCVMKFGLLSTWLGIGSVFSLGYIGSYLGIITVLLSPGVTWFIAIAMFLVIRLTYRSRQRLGCC